MSPRRAGTAVACLIALTLPALAAEPAPAERAARIGSLSGTVSARSTGQQQWLAAVTERALAPGDQVWTQPGAQAKLELGGAALALQEKTQVELVLLSATDAELKLVQGTAELVVPTIGRGENYLIDTPRGTMRVMQSGRFVIEAGSGEEPTKVTAFTGTAQLVGTESGLIVSAGQIGVITGVDGGLSYAVQMVAGPADHGAETAAVPAEAAPPPALPGDKPAAPAATDASAEKAAPTEPVPGN